MNPFNSTESNNPTDTEQVSAFTFADFGLFGYLPRTANSSRTEAENAQQKLRAKRKRQRNARKIARG